MKNKLRLLSWNVNGVRAAIKKGFLEFLAKSQADTVSIQEIKIAEEARIKENLVFPNYSEYWNSAIRPGYSGVATLVRDRSKEIKILSSSVGIGQKKFDIEGRVQTIEFEKFYLVNTYFPNANHELSRLGYKMDFNNMYLKFIKKLDKKKPVVMCGDFNVAHNEIDLARPKENIGNPGFTNEERSWLDKLTKLGYIDTFRHFNKQKVQYSWWSYRAGARERNVGWRIDYFIVSPRFIKHIKNAFILDSVLGSDHCPVGIDIVFDK